MKYLLLFLLPCWLYSNCLAQNLARHKISINDNWDFHYGDFAANEDTLWQPVQLPHSWNTTDAFDEVPGYYRGICWYRKKLDMQRFPSKAKAFLYFEAANQNAAVFINGQLVGTHQGGYTAFCFDITRYLKKNNNWLYVQVDNSHDPAVAPLKGDFTFYGGIYRDVWLILTDAVHFDLLNMAAPGARVNTSNVDSTSAEIQVQGTVIMDRRQAIQGVVKVSIQDTTGQVIQQFSDYALAPIGKQQFELNTTLTSPYLWSPDRPYLYQIVLQIKNNTGQIVDEIVLPLGIRWFSFDADKGFFINGQPLKLLGVNRHQDYPGKANALSNTEHLRDMQLIKDMGANFYRPAHYPQDPAVLEACDRLGLLVTMEIPLDHEQTNSPDFYASSKRMLQEMIRQYYNHPSIIIWAYMNEMFLGRKLERDRVAIEQIVHFAKELEQLTRQEDPTRYTMIPNHGDFPVYHESGLTRIPMIVGWNLYYGWYEADNDGFGKFVDHAHQMLPDKPLIITEYGAGADPRLRSLRPRRFDFSVEWETAFHLNHLRQIAERPFVAGAAVWNMFDFGSEDRIDAVPNINNKGLVSFDRRPKDVYYLYKAWLQQSPFLHLATNGWSKRIAVAEAGKNYVLQSIQAFGNATDATLIHNGTALPTQALTAHTTSWNVPLVQGVNSMQLVAEINGQAHQVEEHINMQLLPATGTLDIQLLSMNLGADFHFNESESGVMWLPEQASQLGSWGFKGGQQYQPRDRGIGSDRDILGTPNDPLFQTQRQGIEQLRFELAPGPYELTLLFAELEKKAPGERQFVVKVNGQAVLPKVDLSEIAGRFRAVRTSIALHLSTPELIIDFVPISGQAVLNGIQIQQK